MSTDWKMLYDKIRRNDMKGEKKREKLKPMNEKIYFLLIFFFSQFFFKKKTFRFYFELVPKKNNIQQLKVPKVKCTA